jgi:hypothetical protein
VTAAGKNVAPAVLEDRMRSNPLVSQVMVVGDAKPFIAALITLDPDAASAWAMAHDLDDASMEQLAQNEDLIADVQSAVDDANQAVSRAEAIKGFQSAATGPVDRGRRAHPDAQGEAIRCGIQVRPSDRGDLRKLSADPSGTDTGSETSYVYVNHTVGF